MAWIERDGPNIKGVYANRQPGYADEQLPDDHADVAAFKNRFATRPKPVTREESLLNGFKALVDKGVIQKADLPKDLTDILDARP